MFPKPLRYSTAAAFQTKKDARIQILMAAKLSGKVAAVYSLKFKIRPPAELESMWPLHSMFLLVLLKLFGRRVGSPKGCT